MNTYHEAGGRALGSGVGNCLLVLLTAVGCWLTLAATASAQKLSPDEMQRSVWDTSYEAIGGGKVAATLVFHGDHGHYDTGAGRGDLSGVHYKFSNTVPGNATVSGKWSMNGVQGKFIFFVAGPAFSGSWQANGMSGNWSGKYTGQN